MADQSATSRLRLLLLVGPVVLSVLLYQRDEFDPAPLPVSASWLIREVPARNDRLLTGSEKVGDGLLPGPEDLAYCAETGFLYTGCSDGWIKRVAINGSLGQVENWAFVGGRPFGLAFGPSGELVVANSEKGLMRLTGEGTAEVLVGEAEGVPFRLTDGVDVAANGIIYFTDASYKYDLEAHIFDILEGRPYGRLMSFEPLINRTRVLVRDLYFANGVAISPGQDFLVFCESPLRRCSRYYIEGEKKGIIDNFVDDLPGFPDNIRYDGDGHYWIGLPSGLMRLTGEGTAELLVGEAEGIPFRLTDGVDVAANGIIYFTDASYKYDLEACYFDILEGRPYGRLMSFDPSINRTRVLVRDLYFANGVAISPGQDFLVFCESPLRRCSRYYIEGEKKGTIDNFVEDLPGFPDNIRYDGDGHFWIGLPSEWSKFSYLLSKYPFLRKTFAILLRYVKLPEMHSKSGVLSVDLAGNPLALYTDPSLSAITCGLKIGTHLYYGSLIEPQIGRIDLTLYAARMSGT